MHRNQYDTDVTVWSPQGRLHQVEYAMEAVKQGMACLGLKSKKFVVLAALQRSSHELSSFQKKIFKIDDHLGISICGLTADARSLTKWMLNKALDHKFIYKTPIQTSRLVVEMADKHQLCTQTYVRRPYGVGLLFGSYDATGTHLMQTEPSGNYYEFVAQAIGSRSQSAKTYLEKFYNEFEDCDLDALIMHALKALSGTVPDDKELDVQNVSIAVVGEGIPFSILDPAQLQVHLDAVAVDVNSSPMEVEGDNSGENDDTVMDQGA